jgi:hypothetical protein
MEWLTVPVRDQTWVAWHSYARPDKVLTSEVLAFIFWNPDNVIEGIRGFVTVDGRAVTSNWAVYAVNADAESACVLLGYLRERKARRETEREPGSGSTDDGS